jgi:recombination protein RecA
MPSSAALRKQIESDFQHRYPSVLTPSSRTIREVVPTGITEIDQLLNGGLPVGAISEIIGATSSGRTSIAMAFLSQRTQECACAWIDAKDSFDPESAAANGIYLNHLLWVRCSNSLSANPIRSLRSGDTTKSQPWTRLDQALRATDLLLQAGGFAAIVLDLGDESIEHGRRIPLATWFRFRQAADRTRCSVIVLGKTSYTQSSAALVLECERGQVVSANGTVIRSFNYGTRRRRERFSPLPIPPVTSIDRKPPVSAWSVEAAWSAERNA